MDLWFGSVYCKCSSGITESTPLMCWRAELLYPEVPPPPTAGRIWHRRTHFGGSCSLQSSSEEPEGISQCQTSEKQPKWIFQLVPTCGMNKMGCTSPLNTYCEIYCGELVQKVRCGAVHQPCAQHQCGDHSWEGAVEILSVAELLNFLSELPARARSSHSAGLTPSCPSSFLPPHICG